jgi:hypothetical protein
VEVKVVAADALRRNSFRVGQAQGLAHTRAVRRLASIASGSVRLQRRLRCIIDLTPTTPPPSPHPHAARPSHLISARCSTRAAHPAQHRQDDLRILVSPHGALCVGATDSSSQPPQRQAGAIGGVDDDVPRECNHDPRLTQLLQPRLCRKSLDTYASPPAARRPPSALRRPTLGVIPRHRCTTHPTANHVLTLASPSSVRWAAPPPSSSPASAPPTVPLRLVSVSRPWVSYAPT